MNDELVIVTTAMKERLDKIDELIKQMETLPGQINSITNNLINVVNDAISLNHYSLREASKLTGLSVRKIHDACTAGSIPYHKDGKTFKILHSDLAKYVKFLKN